MQDCIQKPMYDQARGGRPPSNALEIDVYVGVKEGKAGNEHHHVALRLFGGKHRFLPFKMALRWRWGIATHWSTSHTQLWSAVRYIHATTPHKQIVDKRPEICCRDGRTKLNLFEESQEPWNAPAWKRNREDTLSDPLHKKSKKDAFTKLDFSAIGQTRVKPPRECRASDLTVRPSIIHADVWPRDTHSLGSYKHYFENRVMQCGGLCHFMLKHCEFISLFVVASWSLGSSRQWSKRRRRQS